MRIIAALFLPAVARIVLPVHPASAAGTYHNLGSRVACHPIAPRFGVDTRANVTFTTSADDPGL